MARASEAARVAYEASNQLADRLSELLHEAEASLKARPLGPTWLPEGCEDAPPDIMAKLVAMTAGAGPHPPDPAVDVFWMALCREAGSMQGKVRAGTLGSPRSSSPSGEPGGVEAFADEACHRWEDLEAALAAGVPSAAPPVAPEQPRIEVYATHLTNDDYILGAQVLAASLLATGTARPLLALVTDGVSTQGRADLRDAGWALVEVSLAGVAGEDTPQAQGFFSKIWLWALPCHKVVYIDTDVLVVASLDPLFELCRGSQLAGAPDSQPHMDDEFVVQTGLLVLEPSPERFSDLWEIISGARRPKKLDDWRQLEQGFLTAYFDNSEDLASAGGGCGVGWQRLPGQYNFCARYCLRPLYDGLAPLTTSMVHYACAKPWDPMQRNFAPPAYTQLYLAFAKAAGIPWRTVDCAADRARERETAAKMRRFMEER
ncbi:unnamed protein product, partial [Polarella glacialis]